MQYKQLDYRIFKARMEFRMAISVTPTSANTPIHIFAMPKAVKIRITTLIPRENTMFCHKICMVFPAMRIAVLNAEGSSFIKTTSAASIAASLPMPPIATPISALASTGACRYFYTTTIVQNTYRTAYYGFKHFHICTRQHKAYQYNHYIPQYTTAPTDLHCILFRSPSL